MSRATDLHRQAVRALLLTPERELLLMKIFVPDRPSERFWIAPGGGLEPGESAEEGMRRELHEELGLKAFEMGPLVWRRQHTFDWNGRRICQSERYYIVPHDRFEPVMTDEVESTWVERFCWWPLKAIEPSKDRFTPLTLSNIVHRYLLDGAPQGPLAVETLVD